MNRIDHIRKSEFNRKNHVITYLSCAVLTEAPNVKKKCYEKLSHLGSII